MKKIRKNNKKFPKQLPLLAISEAVAFPSITNILIIKEPLPATLLDDIKHHKKLVFVVTQKEGGISPTSSDELYPVGTLAAVEQSTYHNDGTLHITALGIERAQLIKISRLTPYLIAQIKIIPDEINISDNTDMLRRKALGLFIRLIGVKEELLKEELLINKNLIDLHRFVYFISSTIPLNVEVCQVILELDTIDAKLHYLIESLEHEITLHELKKQLTTHTQERLSKTQREHYLREHLRSIQKELGIEEEQKIFIELNQQLKAAQLPEEAQREAERELERLKTIPIASTEFGIIHAYLDWLANLPWNKYSGDTHINIQHARKILDEDHYDLDKIKDRIIEYLAVKKLRQERTNNDQQISDAKIPEQTAVHSTIREPILCFVGPPGVGKTSLAESIARALGRKFIRTSIGGLHDEAEIRGHRRTYVGALPGRIIQGLKRAEVRNPLFMLDEIDKIGGDWRGDPSAALLEVLDPAQNKYFVDNYLGISFDCSQVLFIATANSLDTIPRALLDRMEIVWLSGYTDEEKIHIAKLYLIPQQLAAHALTPDELIYSTPIIRTIIRRYTREAGVRNLDRKIATICRKVATEIAKGYTDPVHLTNEKLKTYLGISYFYDEVAERTTRPGVATGLVWTTSGGDILFIEATIMPGRESNLILTGMLGDVMQESARIALSYVRANMDFLKIDSKELADKVIHIHMPEGAISKDGPSAGIAMMTALVSLLKNQVVCPEMAMTGELTLRGKVLAVGGIKEKVLAAHRAGIKTIILSHRNEPDLEEVPEELRRELTYIFVDTAEEVLQHALNIE